MPSSSLARWCWIGAGVLGVLATALSIALGTFATRGYMGLVFIGYALEMLAYTGRMRRPMVVVCFALAAALCAYAVALVFARGHLSAVNVVQVVAAALLALVGILGAFGLTARLRRG